MCEDRQEKMEKEKEKSKHLKYLRWKEKMENG